jgi:hypothetical protein
MWSVAISNCADDETLGPEEQARFCGWNTQLLLAATAYSTEVARVVALSGNSQGGLLQVFQ